MVTTPSNLALSSTATSHRIPGSVKLANLHRLGTLSSGTATSVLAVRLMKWTDNSTHRRPKRPKSVLRAPGIVAEDTSVRGRVGTIGSRGPQPGMRKLTERHDSLRSKR